MNSTTAGITGTARLRVRYGETDQMGIVNNAVYSSYFEVGRTQLFRQLGLPYRRIEEAGIILPLASLMIRYHRPAHYDDELTVVTTVKKWPASKITFEYRITNQDDELLVTGETVLAYVNSKTRRPTRIPDFIREIVEPFFREKT